MLNSLRITEIFYSLQGETRTSGLPTVFIRLTGCPLRCRWCDTEYAFQGGDIRTLDEILTEVADFKPSYVTVSGGEPLAQPNCLPLLSLLVNQGYEVSLETSGALDISAVDPRVVRVMDLKPPTSAEEGRNCYNNVQFLQLNDQVKFVIANRLDYEWSVSKLIEYNLSGRVSDVLFSPVHDEMSPEILAGWIIEDNLPVRFQMQLHKLIWGNRPGV